jgi:integrase
MGSLHKDRRFPRGPWYCSYTLADGRRVMRSTRTKSKAQARILCEAWAETERAAASGSLSTSRATEVVNETLRRLGADPIEHLRLKDWLDQWLETKQAMSHALQSRYKFACGQFCEFLGPNSERRFLDSIQERDIRNFALHLKSEGRAATTVNRIIRDLSGAFTRAVRLGKLTHSPFAGIEPEKDQDKLQGRRTFTVEEIARLVQTAQGTDWQGCILFAYTTGARLADAANLAWEAIDLEASLIEFHQRKTGQVSVIAVHPDFADWLGRQPALDKANLSVFPELANRKVGGKNGLSHEFNALVERTEINPGLIRTAHGPQGRSRKGLSFHSLRHTAASNVFNAAAVREAARRITGHAAGGSLDKYVHHDLAAIRAASSLIPRLPL